MVLRLNEKQIRTLRAQQRVSIEIDAETHRLMSELAQQAGADIPTLLIKLARKYKNASWLEKKIVVNFLNGV